MADLQRARGVSEELGRVQRNISNSQELGAPPWQRGRLVENVRFEANVERAVSHKLGRKPRGFIVVNVRAYGSGSSDAPSANAAELAETEFTPNQAKMMMITSGSSPRVYSIWFW